jgi:hypothetical protein
MVRSASSPTQRATGAYPPISCPKDRCAMAELGIPSDAIRKVTYDNALAIYGLSGAMKQSTGLTHPHRSAEFIWKQRSARRADAQERSRVRSASCGFFLSWSRDAKRKLRELGEK